jgi:flagellar basal body rod protein FlgB
MSMGPDLTIDAIRLALGMAQSRAEYASRNIARANTPGAQAVHGEFDFSQALLAQAAAPSAANEHALLTMLAEAIAQPVDGEQTAAPGRAIELDTEVADLSSANLDYQSLTESLNRHFGLMRLAITGKN